METQLETKVENGKVWFSLPVAELKGSFLEKEERIQEMLNEIGGEVSKELLKTYDTTGVPIELDGVKYTSKGQEKKKYETLYKTIEVERHVYQHSGGGATYIPLEVGIGFYGSSSPLLCKIVSMKYAFVSAGFVRDEMLISHKRLISNTLIQHIGKRIGAIAQEKRSEWTYSLPDFEEEICTVGVGLDGTCSPIKGEGFKEVMCGNLSYYNKNGDRLHTTYVGHSPESGKESFYKLLSEEIVQAKNISKNAKFVGIADGASSNWTYLSGKVSTEIIDFFHVAEYVSAVAKEMYGRKDYRKEWLDESLHGLKHTDGYAQKILSQLKTWKEYVPKPSIQIVLAKTITYFENHINQMDYPTYVKKGFPIGSGVTESACKTLVKQRFNLSGSQWSREQMDNLLTLRALILSGRWEQFWQKLSSKSAA